MRRLHHWVYGLHYITASLVAAGLAWGALEAQHPINCLFCLLLVYWTILIFKEPI